MPDHSLETPVLDAMRRRRHRIDPHPTAFNRMAELARSLENPGELTWIGGGCEVCDENAAASPIPDDEEWPNPGPPCHPGCDCEIEWTYTGRPDAPGSVDDLTSQYDDFTLPDDLQQEAERYSGSAQNINGALRADRVDAEMSARLARLDSAIDTAPAMPQQVTTFRGLSTDPKMAVGSQISDLGYWSTTTDQTIANGFSGGTMMEVRVPEGAKGLYMPGVMQKGGLYARESEMVLPRGTTIKVLSRTEDPNSAFASIKYVVEVVPK